MMHHQRYQHTSHFNFPQHRLNTGSVLVLVCTWGLLLFGWGFVCCFVLGSVGLGFFEVGEVVFGKWGKAGVYFEDFITHSRREYLS